MHEETKKFVVPWPKALIKLTEDVWVDKALDALPSMDGLDLISYFSSLLVSWSSGAINWSTRLTRCHIGTTDLASQLPAFHVSVRHVTAD